MDSGLTNDNCNLVGLLSIASQTAMGLIIVAAMIGTRRADQ
jgi:hypothetical protein